MMYEIVLIDGSTMWMNERIIREVHPNEDGTFLLYHFNDTGRKIKSFKQLGSDEFEVTWNQTMIKNDER